MSDDDLAALRELAIDLVKDRYVGEACRLIQTETGDTLKGAARRLAAWLDHEGLPVPLVLESATRI